MKRENSSSNYLIAKVCIFLCFGLTKITFGQDISRVRETIKTLASPEFHGRGYIQKGDSIAANYINQKFIDLGINYLGENGYQYFQLNINTFPFEAKLKLGSKNLITGKDYIPAPNCGTIKGKYKIIFLDSNLLTSKYLINKISSKTAIFLDEAEQKLVKQNPEIAKILSKAGLKIESKTKLTASLSQTVSNQPTIYIQKNVIDKKSKALTIDIQNKFIENYTSQNLIYSIKGNLKPDSFLVLSAHYDHLGRIGPKVYFPGANDNASGIAMLLELANYYKNNPPKYTIIVIAFGAEEVGLIGSEYFVNHPLIPLDKIKFLLNMDLVGTGDDGVQIVNSTIFTQQFNILKSINDSSKFFQTIKTRGKAANSDHYHFSEKGVPAFFVYTLGGIKAYHDIDDTSEKLPLTKFSELFQLTTKFLDSF